MKFALRPLFTTGLFLACVPLLSAAVTYSNLQDIAIPTDFSGVFLDLDTGSTSTTSFTGWDINPFFGGVGLANSSNFQPARIGTGNLERDLRFDSGNLISNNLNYASGPGGSGDSGSEHLGLAADQFQAGNDAYLGFRFYKNDSSGPFYGWMRLTLTANTNGARIRDWAYENTSGTGAVTGRIEQSSIVAGLQTITVSPGSSESFDLGSTLIDSGNVTNQLFKNGAGTTNLVIANSFTGSTTINGGILSAAAAGALANTSNIRVNANGTLLLAGSGNRLGDTSSLTLAGGTFDTGGLSETVGALTLSSDSILNLRSAGVVRFAVSQTSTWSGVLSIWNWTGNLSGGGASQIFVGNDQSGLSASQLSEISFYSGSGTGFLGTARLNANGEIIPVPEPATWLGGGLWLAAIGRHFVRIFAIKIYRLVFC